MTRRRISLVSIASVACVAAGLLPAHASGAGPDAPSPNPVTLAVIGDTPYGADQVAAFPDLITDVNRDPRVFEVVHLGDTKNGSSVCTDEYFEHIADDFATFADPLIYTPGDNEWTDCHHANNGGYDPLERLETVRSVFFAEPGSALGKRSRQPDTQASDPAHRTFAENVRWSAARTTFVTVHVVGSNNGLTPWLGGAETPEQTAAAKPRSRRAPRPLWPGSTPPSTRPGRTATAVWSSACRLTPSFGGGNTGFAEIVRRPAGRSRAFDGEVLLLQGDSHNYLVDQPLRDGHAGYGISEPVRNLTRIVIEGETASEWLCLTVNPAADQPFSWQRVHLG